MFSRTLKLPLLSPRNLLHCSLSRRTDYCSRAREGSSGGQHQVYCLLGFGAVLSGRWAPSSGPQSWPWRWKQKVLPKCWYLSETTRSHVLEDCKLLTAEKYFAKWWRDETTVPVCLHQAKQKLIPSISFRCCHTLLRCTGLERKEVAGRTHKTHFPIADLLSLFLTVAYLTTLSAFRLYTVEW
jgi:hypothetical protein